MLTKMEATSKEAFYHLARTERVQQHPRPRPLLPSLCRARSRLRGPRGFPVRAAGGRLCSKIYPPPPPDPKYSGHGFAHPAEGIQHLLWKVSPTNESQFLAGTALRLASSGLCLPWQEGWEGKPRGCWKDMLLHSGPSTWLRCKSMRAGGFSVPIWLPC